jgi:nucleotide-binding universal stress UspA family protein
MTSGKILFSTDFSELSRFALQYAAAQAKAEGAKLIIAHVEEDPSSTGEGALYSGVSDQTPEETLRRIVPESFAGSVEHRLLRGQPAEEIVRLAGEERVDLIVIGTHGRTGVLRLLMGSVAEKVVRLAGCPVLVVRPPKQPS